MARLTQRSCDPFPAILGEECNTITGLKGGPDETLGKGVHAFRKLAIGPMLAARLAQREQSGFIAVLA
jgi:hypothetical protein